jgi:hypothetical protein
VSKTRFTFLVVLIASALACGTLPPVPGGERTRTASATAVPAILHFENQWVAFDYPNSFKAHAAGDATFKWFPDIDLGGELVVGLGEPTRFSHDVYWRSIRIMRLALPPGADIARTMADAYEQRAVEHPYVLVDSPSRANGPIIVDEREALQKSYRIFVGEPAYDLRDVWIPHKDALYLVAILVKWSNLDALAEFNAVADGIFRTLIIK